MERYKREALNDSLTGLLNRRAFSSLMSSMMGNTEPIPFALAMIDLDRFKKVNDRFGHVAGDKVLKAFSRLLHENMREGLDQAFRYGGEEFAVLSFHSSMEDMINLMKRILELARSTIVEFEGKKIRFTFSAGIAHSKETVIPERLIELADEQLYKAKNEGRNRICYRLT
jgi:diguanylate cyclase (GGDEF)-like protein